MKKTKKLSDKSKKVIKNLKEGKEVKINLRYHDLWMYDFDYIKSLSVKDRNFLKQFWMEMYNGWVVNKKKNLTSVFSDEKAIQNKLDIIHNNPVVYDHFKEELKKYCIKHNKIISEKEFIIVQYQRIANREIKPRRFDTYNKATKIEHPTNDNDEQSKMINTVVDKKQGEINPKARELSDDQKQFIRYFRDNRTEFFIYENLLVLLDGLTYDVAKQILNDLLIAHKIYLDKQIDKERFLSYMYKMISIVMFIVEEYDDKKTVKMLMNVYDNVIYKKTKRSSK